MTHPIPFSVLDLAPVLAGETPREAFGHAVALARHAEALGFHRYWLAEHHNMPGAEQFGTLASLYPGRIDLGLGRAPGGDGHVLRALRRSPESGDRFPRDVQELQYLFDEATPDQPIRAVPGAGLHVPLYLLGSSTFSAELAGLLGLPFAFAAHFAPDALGAALALYRATFRPSPALAAPHAIVCVTIVAADTDAEAHRLFTSQQQAFVLLRRGTPALLQPPIDDLAAMAAPHERANVARALRTAIIGAPDSVERGIAALLAETGADELMVNAPVFDQAARHRSYALVAAARERLAAGGAGRRAA